GGEGPYSDKKLARLQFAASLMEARDAGLAKDQRALAQAAALVAALQDRDGSWQIQEGAVGSPATHGTTLATALARDTLRRIDARGHKEAIARADGWLRKTTVRTVLEAAAVLLALQAANDPEAAAQRRRCLEHIRRGEARRGGWGPYVHSMPEVF